MHYSFLKIDNRQKGEEEGKRMKMGATCPDLHWNSLSCPTMSIEWRRGLGTSSKGCSIYIHTIWADLRMFK